MSNTRAYYRRHLPHWQPPGATIFLTWRLYGSLPRKALDHIAEERRYLEQLPAQPSETPRDRAIRHGKELLGLADDLLGGNDSAVRWLGDERIARLVVDSFFFHAGRLYTLAAFVVMPNHVHLLLWSRGSGVRLESLTHSMQVRPESLTHSMYLWPRSHNR